MEKGAVALINQHFIEALENQKTKKRGISRKKVLILSFLILDVLFACVCIWWVMPDRGSTEGAAGAAGTALRASITGKYKDILTETEIEEWNRTEVEAGSVFLKLNAQAEVKRGDQVYIRLINPPYCTYDYQYTIKNTGGELLYESEVLPPGTVQEYITLNTKIGDQPEEVWFNYSFYNSGDNELVGNKKIAVILQPYQ